MREQLALAIRERTGLDEAMSLQVADVALAFIKERMPPVLAPVVDGQPPDLSDPARCWASLAGSAVSLAGSADCSVGGLSDRHGERERQGHPTRGIPMSASPQPASDLPDGAVAIAPAEGAGPPGPTDPVRGAAALWALEAEAVRATPSGPAPRGRAALPARLPGQS